MDPDEHLIYNSIINEYRQALADAQFALARANAEGIVKDQRLLERTRTPEAVDQPGPPKPGPPPAR